MVPVSPDKVAIVDANDMAETIQHKWYAIRDSNDPRLWYAGRPYRPQLGGKRTTLKMHYAIIDIPKGNLVDHINRNGLDNRRNNLRVATKSTNGANRKKNRNGSSKFKGVYWHKYYQKWHAEIRVNGRTFNLGNFSDEELAARTYDAAARQHFGNFARVNFPLDNEQSALDT